MITLTEMTDHTKEHSQGKAFYLHAIKQLESNKPQLHSQTKVPHIKIFPFVYVCTYAVRRRVFGRPLTSRHPHHTGCHRQSGGLTLPSHTHSSVTRHSPHTGTYVCTYVRTYIHWYDTKPFALTEQCSVYVHHHHSSQLWQHHWHGLTFSCALLLILSHSSF